MSHKTGGPSPYGQMNTCFWEKSRWRYDFLQWKVATPSQKGAKHLSPRMTGQLWQPYQKLGWKHLVAGGKKITCSGTSNKNSNSYESSQWDHRGPCEWQRGKECSSQGVQSWLGPREGWPSSNLLSVNASLCIPHRKQEDRNEEMEE